MSGEAAAILSAAAARSSAAGDKSRTRHPPSTGRPVIWAPTAANARIGLR